MGEEKVGKMKSVRRKKAKESSGNRAANFNLCSHNQNPRRFENCSTS
jgi:hypothetical protein